ncbi:MAG: DNA recombination protein RmuC [Gammaproteobacteria bacterium]|jgi:DNA recombination protein RmuC
MELSNPVQLLLMATTAVVCLIILIVLHFRKQLKQVSLEHQLTTDKIILLNTEIALANQRLEQTQLRIEELKQEQLTDKQSKDDLHNKLLQSERNNQILKVEQEKESEFNQHRIIQFEESRNQLKLEFEKLAGDVLKNSQKQFSERSVEGLDSFLKPFREQIEGFQKRVNEVHTDATKGNAALESEIKKVLEAGLKMGSDAKNLTSALKGDSQKRGGWGEAQLERTLEMSGLIAGAHFEKQSSFKDSEGRRKQTDYLINIPGEKQIIIDSKVSLVAYDRVVAAETDKELNLALNDHANAVKSHIDDLSGKDYTNLIGMRSPSFVLMFMPIEPAYIEALKFNKDLFNYGYEKSIVLVSHTTLIPILRTVANLWMIERSNKEAREISGKAGEIFNQVCEVAHRLGKLGASLTAATNHYNSTLTAITGKQGLHGKVERFSRLSSKVNKSMPVLEPLHIDLKSESLELIAEPLESATEEAVNTDETDS